MARRPRIDIAGIPQHLIVRGNDRRPCFFSDRGRRRFLEYLEDALTDNVCELHAWVLMSNHVHLLVTGSGSGSVSRMMRDVGRGYVQYVNKARQRTGTLFEGRFKSGLVQTERYFLTCMRYIELNPVRAGIVGDPSHYRWSSFGQNASGEPSGLLTPHPEYIRLGVDRANRGTAYRRLVREGIEASELEFVRERTCRNTVLGSPEFEKAVEGLLGRSVILGPRRGRPGGPVPKAEAIVT